MGRIRKNESQKKWGFENKKNLFGSFLVVLVYTISARKKGENITPLGVKRKEVKK